MSVWARQFDSDNSLTVYRAKQMIELIKRGTIKPVESDLVLATPESITVFEEGTFIVRFPDGSEIEYKSTKENKIKAKVCPKSSVTLALYFFCAVNCMQTFCHSLLHRLNKAD